MKKILTHNFGLKILSVVIAFFVWLAVVSVSNPVTSRTREIPLEVLNSTKMEAAGLAYELDTKKSTVTVTYQTHTQDQASISTLDFRAYINLEDYHPSIGNVPVYVEILNGKEYLVEACSAKPAVIRVKTEPLQKKDFDLVINEIGTQQSGYEVQEISLSPKMVTVRGPESVIGGINAVGVEIHKEGIHENTSGTAVPIFYDSNGNQLPLDDRVSVNVSEIAYTIHVVKEKQIALEFEVGGQAAEGYRYTGMETSANAVSVIGDEEIVNAVSVITIPASVLNLDSAVEDRIITVDVEDYLPDKERMSIPWNSQVVVRLRVEPLSQRTIIIPTNRIIEEGAKDEFYYEYSEDSVEVVAEGLSAVLEGLQTSDIIAELDVSSLGVGTYRADLTVEGFPDGVSVVRHSAIQVVVSAKESDADTQPESSQENENLAESSTEAGTGTASSLGETREPGLPYPESLETSTSWAENLEETSTGAENEEVQAANSTLTETAAQTEHDFQQIQSSELSESSESSETEPIEDTEEGSQQAAW